MKILLVYTENPDYSEYIEVDEIEVKLWARNFSKTCVLILNEENQICESVKLNDGDVKKMGEKVKAIIKSYEHT